MDVKKVGVLGAGAMGSGIAQLFAQNGFEVIIRDIKQEFVDRGIKAIDGTLGRLVKKGKMSDEDKSAIMGRIKGTLELSDLKDVDFVVEAVIEDLDLKKDVFKQLDELTRDDVILATNTSSLSITEIAAATKRPDKVIGMHFFNPAPVMRLVEVIMGHLASDESAQFVRDLAEKRLGKVTVLVKKDVAGFIVNRLMIPQLMEAIKIYDEGIASIEDIDKAVKFGLNHPMGPFELMDFTGIDISYFVNEVFKKELSAELKHTTPQSLKAMVRAGKLGRKTGAGWYDYTKK
ncbi:MAG: 3-hydroxybutyryl-CoA dehydrogenase [Deltaproteobacteria bacterium]|nr:MAG: 3-hydroxybutyryl-CoA dehydrogenase [Deltaproteobacteria bacterium]